MLLYIVRHGVTEWNKLKKVQGTADIPLAEEGIRLAALTGEALAGVHFDRCYTSPLSRARMTAECILRGRDVPVIPDGRLREIEFGVLEGTRIRDDQGRYAQEALRIFFDDPMRYERPEGGENLRDVLRRTASFWEDITGNPELQDKTLLISSHGCAVRGLLQNIYHDPENYWHGSVPPNCSVNIVEVKDKKARLVAEDQVYISGRPIIT